MDAVAVLMMLIVCVIAGSAMWLAIQNSGDTQDIRTLTVAHDSTPPLTAFEATIGALAAGIVAAHFIVRLSLDEIRERRAERRRARQR
ncbi:hypothetical protein [Saccharopolyspora phatthalungensis]|uniref:Uncharacterized protein n=1 Tax=Saccharopolyspora phatthalungensis TaxID=664693 RepID=A0A840QDP8_9PSEU|nr:hypothetical protein [Saccharopolyspora phatthalungensis]MBB5155093.1 hypothetical protein [Saccharopolyspora phatthalungensis]